MTSNEQAPRTTVRTRLLRPDLFSDDATGTLPAATLLAYLGLATRADDSGFLIWRVGTLAAAIFPFAIPSRRVRDLERIGEELGKAGLLRLFACGCAELPRMVRDLAIKGGNKSAAVRDWHLAHTAPDPSGQVQPDTDESVPIQTDPNKSVSGSGSRSSSFSESLSGSAHGPDQRDVAGPGSGAVAGRPRAWTAAEWLDELHRLGIPIDRTTDATWSAWLASLQRRHADPVIFEAVRGVVAGGEMRPTLVQELVRVALERHGRDRP